MLVLPGVLASLPLEEVIALQGVKIIGRRGKLLHWNEKSWGKKEAIVQVSDSLPCCWRETSLFSDLEPEERPAPQQHLIFNSSAPLLAREIGSAEIHSLGVIQPGQTVPEHSSVISRYICNISYVCSSSGWARLWERLWHIQGMYPAFPQWMHWALWIFIGFIWE